MRPKLLENQNPFKAGSAEWFFYEEYPQGCEKPLPPRIIHEAKPKPITPARPKKEKLTKEQHRERRLANLAIIREQDRQRRLGNLLKTVPKTESKQRLNKDPTIVRIKTTERYLRLKWRGKVHSAIRSGRLSEEIETLLGCSLKEFREYVSSKFKPGMSWEKRSEWHLDHIKPLFVFNLSDSKQVGEAFHYTNYQPLWPSENCSKGHRIK